MARQLNIPAIPLFSSADKNYSSDATNQNNNVLRLFLIKLTNALNALFGSSGGIYINTPYGAFQDGTDQVAANTTTAYAVTYDTTDFSNTITLSNSSRLNVEYAGLYNVQFSIQFKNTTNDTQDVDVWFRKNGTDIDKSNSKFGIPPRKSSGDPSHIVAAMNFYVSLEVNDYIQIMWKPSDVGLSIEHYAAGTSPTRPAIPSAIVTMNFVSSIPT